MGREGSMIGLREKEVTEQRRRVSANRAEMWQWRGNSSSLEQRICPLGGTAHSVPLIESLDKGFHFSLPGLCGRWRDTWLLSEAVLVL